MIKGKKISVIVLSLFAAISVFFGVYVLMPKTQRSASAETTVNVAKEYFYDFEDGDQHTAGSNFRIDTLSNGNKVLAGGQWSKDYFDEFTLDGFGDAWEISYDIHYVGLPASYEFYDAFRMGMYSGLDTKGAADYDNAGGKFYILPSSFTMSNVYSADSGDYIRSTTSTESRDYRLTFRYNGLNVYINVAPWGSTDIDAEGTWLNVNNSQNPFSKKTGNLCFQLGFTGDYIDNLRVKAIEPEGDALWIANAGSIWGTFTADDADTDESGNLIKNGNTYLTNANGSDYMIMYYKTPLTDNFKISFDYYSSNSGADDLRVGMFAKLRSSTGYSGWDNMLGESNIAGTGGEWSHIAYRYYNGVLYSSINGVVSTKTITKTEQTNDGTFYWSANEYMTIRLKKCTKINNMSVDLNAGDITGIGMTTPPAEGETGLWLSPGGERWDSANNQVAIDTAQTVGTAYDFETDRIYYYTDTPHDSYNRGFIADKNLANVEDYDKSNYYKIDETQNLQFKFDLGLPVNELSSETTYVSTNARIGLFMRNFENPDTDMTGVYLLVTGVESVTGGYKATFTVYLGDGSSLQNIASKTVYTADKYISFDFVYIADAANNAGYISVIAEGRNIVNASEVNFTAFQGEMDSHDIQIDRRYIGYQFKNKNLSLSNISITSGSDVVIAEDALSSASQFEAVASTSNSVSEVIVNNKKLMQVNGPSYPIALSKTALPTNYKVSFDLYTPVMQPNEDPTTNTTLNIDQTRLVFMTDYEAGVGMESKGFAMTFGASGYRYSRSGNGFNRGTKVNFKGDGKVYHIEVEYINGIISAYIDGVLAIEKGYAVERDGDYVAIQTDNAGVYIGNFKQETPAGTEITVTAENEELGTILLNGGEIDAGTVFIVEGEEAVFTFKAKNAATAFVNSVSVDSKEQVVSGKEFTYTLSDTSALSAYSTEIAVKFSARAALAKGTSVAYDNVTTTETNSWKESIYDYQDMYLVEFADTGSTSTDTILGYGLGPAAAGRTGYVTYKIDLSTLATEGTTIYGLAIGTRAKLALWAENARDNCYVDFYLGYQDPVANGYGDFTKTGSLTLRAASAAASSYNAKDNTVIPVDATKSVAYIQIKVKTHDSNWILLRETTFTGVASELTDKFNINYNDFGAGSVDWANGAYDYSGLEMVSHDGTYSLGVSSTSSYGYITYKLNYATKLAQTGVEGIMVASRGKLTNWSGSSRTDNYYIDYYVGYTDGIANGYDSYAKLYEASVEAGSTPATDKYYAFKLNPDQGVVYLQIRIRSATQNWIALRETTIDFVSNINSDNGFKKAYDGASVTSVFDAVEDTYDYGNLKYTTFDLNHGITAATTSTYGYITYKVVAPQGKKFEAIDIELRNKASNFSGGGRTDSYYIDYYVGFEEPFANGYTNYTCVEQGEIGSGNANYNDIHNIALTSLIEGKTEFYFQVRIKDGMMGWLALREITIDAATYQTVQLTLNYGTSYTEYNYNQLAGAMLDTSVINIRDTFVRVDDKIYTDATFETEFNVNTVINQDTVLYIKVANGLITYELNGGVNAASNKGYYESITAVSIADATKGGSVFGGWYTDSTFETLFTGIAQGRTGDITLYAKWVDNANQYILYYNANGGTIEGLDYDSEKAMYYVPYYKEIGLATLAVPTKSGSVFKGWYAGDVKYTSIAVGTEGGITLVAQWETEKESAITGATLTIGKDLTLNYYAYTNGTSVTIKFTLTTATGEKQVVVSGTQTGSTVNGKTEYVFAFKGIAPHMMGDNIKAELIVDNVVVDTKAEYSVLTYCTNQLANSPSTELATLIADVLEYGATSQTYKNYKTDSLVNEGIEGKSTFVNLVSHDFTNSNSTEEGLAITGAGVWFDFDNRLYVKYTGNATKITVSAQGLTETEITETLVSGDVTQAFTNGISALEFDKIFTFKLYNGDVVVQTVTYSVKTFVCNMQTKDNAAANLAKALYNYGLSSVAYKDSIA